MRLRTFRAISGCLTSRHQLITVHENGFTVPHKHEDRVICGRIGGYTRAAMYDSREMTAPARRAFDERFDHQVDPDGILPPAERAKRAGAARKAYFAALAQKSATARRRAREATEIAESAEQELRETGGDAA